MPVVVVDRGGFPVTEATNDIGVPVTVADNGFGIAVTLVGSGGLPIVGIVPSWVLNSTGSRPTIDMDFQNSRYYGRLVSGLTVTRASQAYADNVAGVWTSFASGVARITDKGLLVEEARTNSVRNNSMQGVVAGSPGTLPTNWGVGGAAGLTRTIVGTGTENGVEYIDLNFAGTTSGTFATITFDTATAISALTAQTWTQSVFVSLTNSTNISFIELTLFENTSGGAQVRQNNTLFTPTTSLVRRSQVSTLSGGGTVAAIQPSIQMGWANGAAINFTIRVGWPQLGQGASVTSPIRTTTVAVTRAADAVSLTSPPTFGTEYSAYIKGTPQAPSAFASNQVGLYIDDNTFSNRLGMFRNGSVGNSNFVMTSGGAAQATGGAVAWAIDTSGKAVVAATPGDQAFSFNGATVLTGTGALMPSGVNQVHIGSGPGSAYWNGFIERIALWPNRRLPNAEMQSVTF